MNVTGDSSYPTVNKNFEGSGDLCSDSHDDESLKSISLPNKTKSDALISNKNSNTNQKGENNENNEVQSEELFLDSRSDENSGNISIEEFTLGLSDIEDDSVTIKSSQSLGKKKKTSGTLKRLSTFACSSDEYNDEEAETCRKMRSKKKRKLTNRDTQAQNKKLKLPANKLPSVYSNADIRSHERRLKKLKALEEESESESEEKSEPENVDPNLDINLRIFESPESVESIMIGEIQCNVRDEAANHENINENGNKNSNVFKVSVNANFSNKFAEAEKQNNTEKLTNEDDIHDIEMELEQETDDSDDLDRKIDAILSDNFNDFSDENDSDLEVLVSKPLIRKRVPNLLKKDKPVVSSDDNKKLTMYDLVCESIASRNDDSKDENGNGKKKADKRNKSMTDSTEEVIGKIAEPASKRKSTSSQVAVPQLKVTADGEVVLDMDSLVIEQTGLSDAREAIDNQDVIEEYAFSNTSYSKKRNNPKQWSPQETLKFYHVLSTLGTDFSLMATLFPGRTRTCMKRKFKREEKANSELITKALSCKQNFDMKLLEKELRLKEAKVNELRLKSRKKLEESKKADKVPTQSKQSVSVSSKSEKKPRKNKRLSFFEKGIQCFQNA